MKTPVTPDGHGHQPLALPTLHAIRRARAGRKLAMALFAVLLVLPAVMLFVPWQQNVPGAGRVVAFDPKERIRTIPAPVAGRLVELFVRDGSRVKKGDLLVRMEDQDPDFLARLEQQYELDQSAADSARDRLLALDDQLIQLEEELNASIEKADREIDVAIEKVREATNEREAADAARYQKELDYERKRRGYEQKVISQLEFQEAERQFREAESKLGASKAKEEGARADEAAKVAGRRQVAAGFEAKIAEAKAKRADASIKWQEAQSKLQDAQVKIVRQRTQEVLAPMDGTILSVNGASSSDLISKGAPLIEFMPDTEQLAVEMWMRGIDAPLITPGRQARLVFEGWPAVQFAGWPSVAVGTFGGVVQVVDAQAAADGRVRVLVLPDPDDERWPSERFLRQGVRTTGWIQLETVSAGYEIWRQLNAFPPTIRTGPPAEGDGTKGSKSGKEADPKS